MSCVVVFVALCVSLFSFAVSAEKEELGIEVLKPPKEGCYQASVEKQSQLKFHYTGTLASDGTQFDSSYERNQPLPVTLGKHMVIQGMEMGLDGACVGEVRLLTIPPHLGYGDRGAGGAIPGGATIKFKIEVTEITGAPGEDEL